MLFIYRILNGYLKVAFSGDISETVLNICAQNGISLWNSRSKGGKIICCITIRDFKYLRQALRGKGIRAHITEKHGLPFLRNSYKKRYGIAVGAVLFFLLLKLMSMFLWNIEVVGNTSVSTEDILFTLEKLGIHEGAVIKNINPNVGKQQLLIEMDSLAWASLNIEGCRLTVNVTEISKKEENKDAPLNLKATADGVIRKIDIISGNCVVKVGDTVKKGDLLVSGIKETENTTEFVRSKGVITALTEREFTFFEKYEIKGTRKTGKTKEKSVLSFFTVKLPLYIGCEKESYEEIQKIKCLKLFGTALPIRTYTKKFIFTEETVDVFTREQLEKRLIGKAETEIKNEKITDFKTLKQEFTETDDGLKLKMLISAEENIAKEEILLFNTGNSE